ncbi:MAG: iron ABC transporter permease [Anaerolineaceae bacterium]|nr:iron ABC transporter permease [Anaerolineaceae bacterium]
MAQLRKFSSGKNRGIIPQKHWFLWAFPLLFLLLFYFYPLAATFRLAFEAALEEGIRTNLWSKIWRPLGFTITQASLSTLFTLIIGLPSAFVFARFKFPGKKFYRVLITIPFIMPTVVVAASFNAMLGPRGWLNLILMQLFALDTAPIEIMNSLTAIILAHVFYNTTIIIRVVGTAWSQLDTRLEQSSRSLGASAWRSFWEITLPLLKPSLLSAALLVFLFDFTSFGVILLLGGPRFSTLEVEIYIQTIHMFNLPAAGLLSAVQLVFTLILTIIYSRIGSQNVIAVSPRLKGEGIRSGQLKWEIILIGLVLSCLSILLVLPLVSLFIRSFYNFGHQGTGMEGFFSGFTLDYYRELFINRRGSLFYVPPIKAGVNSILYALATVAFALPLGFISAYALKEKNKSNRWMDAVLTLPLGTSAVTLGLGFILVFNKPPLDMRTFPLILPIAHSLVALPFVVRTIQPALASIPESLHQAAQVLGASRWQVWKEVDLPVVSRAVLVSSIFAFTVSLGEFGATTFLARPETPTLPIAIFRFLSQPGSLNYGQAMAMSTLLMLVCGVSILIMEYFQER